jgi:hypothetical protein
MCSPGGTHNATFSDQQRQDRTSEDKHKLALRDASWMESVYLFMLITNDIWVLFFVERMWVQMVKTWTSS